MKTKTKLRYKQKSEKMELRMNENNDIKILDSVERYIRGEMNPDERLHFENLRKTNGEIDQLVVEHTLFLQQMNRFGEWKKFHSTLQDVHTDLAQQGKINAARFAYIKVKLDLLVGV